MQALHRTTVIIVRELTNVRIAGALFARRSVSHEQLGYIKHVAKTGVDRRKAVSVVQYPSIC